MSDPIYSGLRYRILNVFDACLREALDIVVDTSLPTVRVVRALEQIKQEQEATKIRVGTGAEMTTQVFVGWCRKHRIDIASIEPGKPNQNASIERFNRSYRTEVLT